MTLVWKLFLVLNFGLIQSLYSQGYTKSVKISGIVVNEQDEIMKVAAILIQQTTTSTVTDTWMFMI